MTVGQRASLHSNSVILGFREESLPKGHGYLFWRLGKQGAEVRVCDCDLFEVSPEVIQPMFEKALQQILIRLNAEPGDIGRLDITFENMSPLALELFDEEKRRLSILNSGLSPNGVPTQERGNDSPNAD